MAPKPPKKMSSELDKKLIHAAYLGNLEEVRRCVAKGADVNALDESGYSPLMRAAQKGCGKTIAWLLENGADLNYTARDQHCALTLLNDQAIVEQLLLEPKAFLDQRVSMKLMNNFNGNRRIRDLLNGRGIDLGEWRDSFRDLYHRILGYGRWQFWPDILEPALPIFKERLNSLAYLRNLKPLADAEHLFELYALNRVNDLLLLSFQPVHFKPRSVASVTQEEYAQFFEGLGFEICRPQQFTPFFHEIVEVYESSDEMPVVTEMLWPAVMFGKMLFSRAGVKVKASPNVLRKDFAENSPLYFSHRRLNRSTTDASIEWGSNSQWATTFRRDYVTNDAYLYNIDGPDDVTKPGVCNPVQKDLSTEQRIELLTYRCWVQSKPERDHDWYPYSDTYKQDR